MPLAIGTNDGGAIIALQDEGYEQTPARIVRMDPDGSTREFSIAPHRAAALGPDGTVMVFDQAVGYSRVVLGD